jgi:hypothetical protein
MRTKLTKNRKILQLGFISLFSIAACVVIIPLTSCFGGNDYKPIPTDLLDIREDESTNEMTLYGLNTKGEITDFSKYDTLLIPSNVKVVEDNAFNQELHPNESFNKYIENIDYATDAISIWYKIGVGAFAGMSNLADATLPRSFTTFSANCFQNCIEFAFLEIDALQVIPFVNTMLDNTSFNVDPSLNDAGFIL